MRIALSRPDIGPQDIDAVVAVLQTPHLSLGPQLEAFEQRFAEIIGTRHAVAVSSGTAALHIGLLALGLEDGDEVLTSPFSFIASANVALMVGGRPVFVDIDPVTWNLDVAQLHGRCTARTRAILPVHVFGQPAAMDTIMDCATQRDLVVVEDACEALGATWDGRKAGSFGDLATFAFYPNKQITTGEGGMIVTDRTDVATMARSLRNQGRDAGGGWLAHPRMGYNYRLSDINCALGLAQLGRLPDLLERRARVARWYRERLGDEARVHLQHIDQRVHMSWFVFVIRLSDTYDRADRDRVLHGLIERGIGCSNYFVPIHLQPFYAERFGYRRGDFPHCEHVADRTVALPFHPGLTEGEVDEVCSTLREML